VSLGLRRKEGFLTRSISVKSEEVKEGSDRGGGGDPSTPKPGGPLLDMKLLRSFFKKGVFVEYLPEDVLRIEVKGRLQ